MSTMTQTISDYATEKGITVEIVRDRGAQVDKDGWEHHAYELKLHNAATGEALETPWKQGYGIEDSPVDRPDSVLDSLISDSAGYFNAQDFEDFANEYGYDTDSLSAYRIYEQLKEIAPTVVTFLGGQEEFERVAYEIERL